MAQRRFHYDQAFEHYLRAKEIPYVAVDEAKRALASTGSTAQPVATLKNFDFVVYSENGPNLLVDVKGRKHTGKSTRSLDNWVTQGDVDSLLRWEKLFGEGFQAAFVFLYWCAVQPPDALFQEIFAFGDRWYAVLAIRVCDYQQRMKRRSPRWETVNLPAEAYRKLSRPLMEML